jgi:hypothetical protein
MAGILEGFIQGVELERKHEDFQLNKLKKQLELQQKTAEIEDYKYATGARRRGVDVKEKESERQLSIGKELDKAAILGVENTIGDLERKIDDRGMENIVRSLGDINTQEIYDIEYKKLPDAFKKTMGTTGNLKKDKSKIDYLQISTMHNIKQRRDIEKLKYQAGSKGKVAPYTPPAKPQYFDVNTDLVGIKARMSQHPQFKQLATGWFGSKGGPGADVFDSPEIMAVTAEVATSANSIMYDSYNKTVGGRSHYVMNPDEAMNLALEKKLSYLHNSNPGEKELTFLSPEQAEIQKQRWVSSVGQQLASRVPGFSVLPPALQMQEMQKAYEDYQMHTYLLKKNKTNDRTLYAE